jgi:hypothetical protein
VGFRFLVRRLDLQMEGVKVRVRGRAIRGVSRGMRMEEQEKEVGRY